MDISIIIPFLNEQDNAANLVAALNHYFSTQRDFNAEVILVDDGSTDNSLNVFRQQSYSGYPIKLVKLSRNFGSHAAVRAGMQYAEGQYVIFLPADLQDPLGLLHDCFKAAKASNAEIVYAFRSETNNSLFDKLFSHLYARMMKRFVNEKYPKQGFDVVFFGERVKRELNKNIEPNSSVQLQILSLGYNSVDIYYRKEARKYGSSKWTISKKIKLLIDSFVAFSFAPIRFVSLVGILFFAFGVFWTIYIISRKLLYNDLASGWPALTSILLLGFGITNIGLGIIAEYLWRTLDASRKRPVFIIDEIIELNSANS